MGSAGQDEYSFSRVRMTGQNTGEEASSTSRALEEKENKFCRDSFQNHQPNGSRFLGEPVILRCARNEALPVAILQGLRVSENI